MIFYIPVSVIHMTSCDGHYQMTQDQGQALCQAHGLELATIEELQQAWEGGYDMCSCGWLADGTVKYPITEPRAGCETGAAGLRTCTDTSYPTGGLYNVYCSTAGGRINVTHMSIIVIIM